MVKRAARMSVLALALAAAPAWAQNFQDWNGWIPVYPGQHNLAPSSVTKMTIPGNARFAVVCASTGTVEYTTDGTTPSGSVGMPLASGACVGLVGAKVLAGFQAFSSSGTLDIEYFR